MFVATPRVGAYDGGVTMVARRFAMASAVALSAWAAPARAEDLVVKAGESATLSGEHVYRTVTIEGTLLVGKFDGKDPNSGWLRLKSNSIKVSAGARIDANGRGHRGALAGAEGTAMGAGTSPTPASPDDAEPLAGGGGAHIGNGGTGSLLETKGNPPKVTCTANMAFAGGKAYDDATMAFVLVNAQQGMGSAGGTSHAGAPNPTVNIPGGNGGGAVMFEAATIELLGSIEANGVGFAGPLQGASAGAGAGGTIYLHTHLLTTGMETRLKVEGGVGMVGNLIGGSGGGGLIVLASKEAPPLGQVTVSGGASPEPACTSAKGADGTLYQLDPGPCLDIDADMHGSDSCGGDDCDDTNAAIHPGQPEICDGIDQDCSGTADDADDASMCLKNETCNNGKCVPLPPNTTGPTSDAVPHIVLEGGLCTWSSSRSANLWPAAALGLAAIALRRSRRRHPR